MKKILLKIFIFFILLSIAAKHVILEFQILEIKEDLNIESLNYEPLMMPDRFGGENIMIPSKKFVKMINLFGIQNILLCR